MIMKKVVTALMIIGFTAAMAGCATVEPSPGIDTQPIGAPPPPQPLYTLPVF
jgi:hypothetical protein